MKELKTLYDQLYEVYGDLGWWPGNSPDEVIIGAILTQNTSWANVEKSLSRLREEGLLSLSKVAGMDKGRIAELIRSSGFYNQKSERILIISREIIGKYGSVETLRNAGIEEASDFLKGLNGIGKETLDSILLYALDFPKFVIDSYTIRIFGRFGLIEKEEKPEDIQKSVEMELEYDIFKLKNLHGMLVELAKQHCRKKPLCNSCPLKNDCEYYREVMVP